MTRFLVTAALMALVVPAAAQSANMTCGVHASSDLISALRSDRGMPI